MDTYIHGYVRTTSLMGRLLVGEGQQVNMYWSRRHIHSLLMLPAYICMEYVRTYVLSMQVLNIMVISTNHMYVHTRA